MQKLWDMRLCKLVAKRLSSKKLRKGHIVK